MDRCAGAGQGEGASERRDSAPVGILESLVMVMVMVMVMLLVMVMVMVMVMMV